MRNTKIILLFLLLSLSLSGCKKASFSFTLTNDKIKEELSTGETGEGLAIKDKIKVDGIEPVADFSVGNTYKLICKGAVLNNDSTGLHSTDVYRVTESGNLEVTGISDDLSQSEEAVVKFISETGSELNVSALLYITAVGRESGEKPWEQWEITEDLKSEYQDAVLHTSMIEGKNIIFRQITGVKHEDATKGGKDNISGATEFSITKESDYGKSIRAFVKVNTGDSFVVEEEAELLLSEMLSKIDIFESVEAEIMEVTEDKLEDLILFQGSKVERSSLVSLLQDKQFSTASNYSSIKLVPGESKVIQLKKNSGQADEDKAVATVKNTGKEVVSLMDATVIRLEVVFASDSLLSEDFLLLSELTGGYEVVEGDEVLSSHNFTGTTGYITESKMIEKIYYELTIYFAQGRLHSFTLLCQ